MNLEYVSISEALEYHTSQTQDKREVSSLEEIFHSLLMFSSHLFFALHFKTQEIHLELFDYACQTIWKIYMWNRCMRMVGENDMY